ncbi:MAG TPA: DUF2334 domain-containing protein [Acidobacteriota bacterium]
MNRDRANRARFPLLAVLALSLCFSSNKAVRGASDGPPPGRVLILYDSTGQFGWVGQVDALYLANLIGHFQLTAQITPVEKYSQGQMEDFRAVFYLGSVWNNDLPNVFLQDVLNTGVQVCWFKYNLWQMPGNIFDNRFGFRVRETSTKDFGSITYKSQTFSKNRSDAELGLAKIVGPISLVAQACSADSECTPYIIQSRNFWYVADIPFTYVDEEDRYIVFTDVLHDILNIDHPSSHRAIIRIEGVNPYTSPEALTQIADLLDAEGVPFAVSVTPVFVDSLGLYNNRKPVRVTMSEAPDFVSALRYMVRHGGTIVLNGYTHQNGSSPNPFTGVTGEDFEFFHVEVDPISRNVVSDGPVVEDSLPWVTSRVESARSELENVKLQSVVWQTPFYAASPLDYQVFASIFPATMGRDLNAGYAILPRGPGGKGPMQPPFFASQIFPYLIPQDVYGQKVIPENLGGIDPGVPWTFRSARLPPDLVRAAAKDLVVRDGFASAYFHWYLAQDDLRDLVKGIKDLGYTFVAPSPDLFMAPSVDMGRKRP